MTHRTKQSRGQCNGIEALSTKTKLPDNINKTLKFIIQPKIKSSICGVCRLRCPVTHCAPNPETSSTTDVQQHLPCAFSYFMKCSFDDDLNKHRTFVGENSPIEFIKMLTADLTHLHIEIIGRPKPMIPLTQRQKHHQNTSQICSICVPYSSFT